MNRRRLGSIVALLGGLGALGALVGLGADADVAHRPMLYAPLLGALALSTIILLLVGVSAWRSSSSRPAPEAPDYGHTYLIFAGVAVLLVAGAGVRHLFVPPSFGMAGRHYRAEALTDARRQKPRHLGEKRCMDCHDDIAKLHDKDAHARVACETCHGPGACIRTPRTG